MISFDFSSTLNIVFHNVILNRPIAAPPPSSFASINTVAVKMQREREREREREQLQYLGAVSVLGFVHISLSVSVHIKIASVECPILNVCRQCVDADGPV